MFFFSILLVTDRWGFISISDIELTIHPVYFPQIAKSSSLETYRSDSPPNELRQPGIFLYSSPMHAAV